LDGRRIVYASLGTLQNRLRHLFANIVEACTQLDVQLISSLGRHDAELDLPPASNAIIVPYAPQLKLLQRAAAVVTHAGLNTVLEALSCGLPMVAIPLTNDQPGVARRLVALGAAELVAPRTSGVKQLRGAIARVLEEKHYRDSAEHCQQQCRSAPSAADAAELVGFALANRVRLTREAAIRSSLGAGRRTVSTAAGG
jgi:MGT family glycosyltransferase